MIYQEVESANFNSIRAGFARHVGRSPTFGSGSAGLGLAAFAAGGLEVDDVVHCFSLVYYSFQISAQ
ncbi:MAG: hypothetical protein OEV15_05150 [Gallionella sp.]|nr:hypothetical protein [Gallionella sp.]